MHALDELLPRIDRFDHLLAEKPRADVGGELLADLEVDVGLEQGHADLSQDLVYVVFGEASFAAKLTEDGLETI